MLLSLENKRETKLTFISNFQLNKVEQLLFPQYIMSWANWAKAEFANMSTQDRLLSTDPRTFLIICLHMVKVN